MTTRNSNKTVLILTAVVMAILLLPAVANKFPPQLPDPDNKPAAIAFGGWDLKGPGLTIANAQLAVSGEKGKYPDFKGNVKSTISGRVQIREEYC